MIANRYEMTHACRDLAGVSYWEKVWSAPTKPAFDPNARPNQQLAALLRRFLTHVPDRGLIAEAGCADSTIAPFLGSLGYCMAGIDYSEAGCAALLRSAPGSAVYHADIFDPPRQLIKAADAVYSLGLVEHFTDTAAVMGALARLVKPGGVLLTVVPNMHGTVGTLQRVLNRRAFEIHVALTPQDLVQASQFEVLQADYLGGAGYGVINPGDAWLSRAIVGALARMSVLARDLPVSRAFSPHLFCLSRIYDHA